MFFRIRERISRIRESPFSIRSGLDEAQFITRIRRRFNHFVRPMRCNLVPRDADIRARAGLVMIPVLYLISTVPYMQIYMIRFKIGMRVHFVY